MSLAVRSVALDGVSRISSHRRVLDFEWCWCTPTVPEHPGNFWRTWTPSGSSSRSATWSRPARLTWSNGLTTRNTGSRPWTLMARNARPPTVPPQLTKSIGAQLNQQGSDATEARNPWDWSFATANGLRTSVPDFSEQTSRDLTRRPTGLHSSQPRHPDVSARIRSGSPCQRLDRTSQ